MSVSITTFASGAVIDATTIRTKISDIETYLNEGMIAADRGSAWLGANHVYRPDFFGAPDPHTTLTSGESYFRQRSIDDRDRAFTSYYVNTASWLPVPGLNITYQVPETLAQGASAQYRLMVFASFYVYEYGGNGGNYNVAATGGMDEDTWKAGAVSLSHDGTHAYGGFLNIYNGSVSGNYNAGTFYPRKQYTRCFAFAGSPVAGTHNIGISVYNYVPGADEWKHIIFQQGNFTLRYSLR